MKKIGLMVAVVVGVFAARAEFLYECNLTVAGYRGSGTVRNFPVLVKISPSRVSGFQFANCRPDGYDVRFVSSDESVVYPHEIESWNLDGVSYVWVRLPEISGTATTFKMLYGDPDLSTAPDGRQVWAGATGETGGRYAGVWHLSEEIDDAHAETTVSADSAKVLGSEFVFDGEPSGWSKAQMVSTNGVVGNGRVNNTYKGQGQLVMPAYEKLGVGGSFAFSGWFKADGIGTSEGSSHSHVKLFGRAEGDWCEDATTFSVDLRSHTTAKCYGFDVADLPDCTEDWTHFAIVYDGQQYAFYANGALKTSGTMTKDAITDDDLPLRIGGASTFRYALYGKYDELRLLDAVPSADWFQAEYDTVHDAAYVTAGAVEIRGAGTLDVTASGDEIGAVSPAYGRYSGSLQEGSVIACTASVDAVTIADDLRERLQGWKIYEYESSGTRADEPYDEASTNQVNYVHRAGRLRNLEWQTVKMRPLTLASSRAATYLINGVPASAGVTWVDEGLVTVDVIASEGTEGADFVFVGWQGDTASVVGGSDATNIVLNVSGAVSLTANYNSLHFVSAAAGDDDTGDGSRDKPWATINHAIDNAATQDGDEIHIAGGMYEEKVVNNVRSRLTIRGGYKADWTRDLRHSPTVIYQKLLPWYNRSHIVNIGTGIVSNTLDGLVLTGGRYGIYANDYYGHRFERLVITNNAEGVYIGSVSAKDSDAATTVTVVSSYISHNGDKVFLDDYSMTGSGIWIYENWRITGNFHILNCTIVSNGTYGVKTGRFPISIVNSVIAENGWSESRSSPADLFYVDLTSGYATKIRSTAIWNSRAPAGIVLSRNPVPYGYLDDGTLRVYSPKRLWNFDPMLNADGTLSAESQLLGMGEDLSDAAIPVTTDVYGEPFRPGAYDLGCFKAATTRAQPAKSSDLYVATDGDDANAGTSAEDPLKSVGLALTRVAENGTIHVAAGTYGEAVVLDVPGVTLEGAGRDETVFRETNSTNSFGLYVGAPQVTVKKLAVENAMIGLQLSDQTTATNALVEECRLAGNRFGFVHLNEGHAVPGSPGLSVPVFHFSRLIVTNNSLSAGYVANMGAPFVFDASLFGLNGFANTYYGGPYTSGTKAQYYNCTFASNANYSVWAEYGGNNSRDARFYNCIFTGSPVALKFSYHYVTASDCIFDCTTNYIKDGLAMWSSTNRLYDVAAPLDWRAKKWARPLPGSLAAKGGTNLNGTGLQLYDVPCDLDGVTKTWKNNKWFIGCYAPVNPGLTIIVR